MQFDITRTHAAIVLEQLFLDMELENLSAQCSPRDFRLHVGLRGVMLRGLSCLLASAATASGADQLDINSFMQLSCTIGVK